MKQSSFLGWIKKAYPSIKSVKKENGDVWLSDGNFLQVSAKVNDIFEFHKLGSRELTKPVLVSEDADIVKNIRDLWGEPAVAFSYPKPTPKKEESKPEPKKEQPKLESAPGREDVISLLKKEFPDAIEIIKVPGGKAVKINGSKLTLYDYGISSKPSEFIPWAREEEVRQCITKFIKQHHE